MRERMRAMVDRTITSHLLSPDRVSGDQEEPESLVQNGRSCDGGVNSPNGVAGAPTPVTGGPRREGKRTAGSRDPAAPVQPIRWLDRAADRAEDLADLTAQEDQGDDRND